MRPALALVVLAACGLGGADGGGDRNLPVSGAGPYGKLTDYELATPLDEPFLLFDGGADLTDPAPVDTGDGIRLFYTRRAGGAAEIWRADVRSLAELPDGAERVLAAEEPWEAGGVSAPSPFAVGDTLYLVYQAGDPPALGWARSTDGGASFERLGVLLEDAAQPAALQVGRITFLYFVRGGAIHVARAFDLVRFEVEPAAVLAPGSGFDAAGVDEPAAIGGMTEAGRLRIGLFYTGTGATGVTAVGYAGSFDSVTFTRAAEPVLDASAPGERGAGPLLSPTSGILFFSQPRGGRAAIAVATAP